MKKLNATLPCPSCSTPMEPRVLGCDRCELRVEGKFSTSEFAGLTPELLHFLRIFVHCEGRIKDMEKSLGVSYPTVKATMTRLKGALGMSESTSSDREEAAAAEPDPEPETRLTLLAKMERGEIAYADGLKRLKKLKR